jgi:hypothetical protein
MDNQANTDGSGSNGPAKPATPHDPAAKEAPAGGNATVSRAPLNLGGSGVNPAVGTPAAHSPGAAAPAAVPSAIPRAPAPQAPIRRPLPVAAAPRTTNCKTFFTKLHPGALNFLDEQISKWLRENPNVVVKHTNVTTGEVVDKKTEPNILITIWY